MSDPNKSIKHMTSSAVLVVAAIAAVVSFEHIYHLAITHGQPRLASYLLPVSVDGTVATASSAMLWAARSGLSTPWLARVMLGLGVTATLGANAAYGAPYGPTGILLSGWPGIAFVGSVEIALGMVRRARKRVRVPVPDRVPVTVPDTDKSAPDTDTPMDRFAADANAGKLPGVRQIKREMSCGTARAQRIRDQLAAAAEAA